MEEQDREPAEKLVRHVIDMDGMTHGPDGAVADCVCRADCSFDSLMETNRRLNRRCQEAESTLAIVQRSVGSSSNMMAKESRRARTYANKLREIYRYHQRIEQDHRKCWNCRIRWWVRHQIWNRWFAIR